MTDFSTLLQQGNAWLFMPSAILLGALHGLEPGHSKTMMAAFIVAIRGTVMQAVLLGLAATLSHTAIVWAVAMAGLYFGNRWDAHSSEPYFQLVSALLIIAIAFWMMWRTWQQQKTCFHDHEHDHEHDDAHKHIHQYGNDHPENQSNLTAFGLNSENANDAHAQAHAKDIRQRFAGREVTTGQVIIFGLTGGLIPCPASITVLLLCLQLKKIALGASLVLCFSVGLALTMVASGTLAALSIRHVESRWGGLGNISRQAPYFSGVVISLVGFYVAYQGLLGLGWL